MTDLTHQLHQARQTLETLMSAQALAAPTFCQWMRERHPHGWVIARRSPRMIEKYGEGCSFLTPAASAKECATYEAETGLPHSGGYVFFPLAGTIPNTR